MLEKFKRLIELEKEVKDLEGELRATKVFYQDMFYSEGQQMARLLAFLKKQQNIVKDLYLAFGTHGQSFEKYDCVSSLHSMVNQLYTAMQEVTANIEQEHELMTGAQYVKKLEESIEDRRKALRKLKPEFVKRCISGLGEIGLYMKYGAFAPDKETLSKMIGTTFGVEDEKMKYDIVERLYNEFGFHSGGYLNVRETDAEKSAFDPKCIVAEHDSTEFYGLSQKPQIKHGTIVLEATCRCKTHVEMSVNWCTTYDVGGKRYEIDELSAVGIAHHMIEFTGDCDIDGKLTTADACFYDENVEIAPIVVRLPSDISVEEASALFDQIADDFCEDTLIQKCEDLLEKEEQYLKNKALDFIKTAAYVNVDVG